MKTNSGAATEAVKFGLMKRDNASIVVSKGTMNEFMNGRSKFVQGRQFKVTGWDYAFIQPADGSEPAVNTRVFAVLTTDIDDETNIWLSSYYNPKLDANNQDVVADGDADKLIRKLLNENGDVDKEKALDAIVEALKGKTLIVRRKRYIGRVVPEGKPSFTKAMSIPCFELAEPEPTTTKRGRK